MSRTSAPDSGATSRRERLASSRNSGSATAFTKACSSSRARSAGMPGAREKGGGRATRAARDEVEFQQIRGRAVGCGVPDDEGADLGRGGAEPGNALHVELRDRIAEQRLEGHRALHAGDDCAVLRRDIV